MQGLSSNNRLLLLRLVREAIAHHLETGNILAFHTQEAELTQGRGCFVTLRKHGKLRGCVGTFDADRPLYENVLRMAVAAAFHDVRFPAVEKNELGELTIEISVLGPLTRMRRLEDLELGVHGVLVRYGLRSGTFLPEVAIEQKWSREEFVTFCAREKAGLSPAECAKAEVFLYTVEKFSEENV